MFFFYCSKQLLDSDDDDDDEEMEEDDDEDDDGMWLTILNIDTITDFTKASFFYCIYGFVCVLFSIMDL